MVDDVAGGPRPGAASPPTPPDLPEDRPRRDWEDSLILGVSIAFIVFLLIGVLSECQPPY